VAPVRLLPALPVTLGLSPALSLSELAATAPSHAMMVFPCPALPPSAKSGAPGLMLQLGPLAVSSALVTLTVMVMGEEHVRTTSAKVRIEKFKGQPPNHVVVLVERSERSFVEKVHACMCQ
jgi:hypothetical protein